MNFRFPNRAWIMTHRQSLRDVIIMAMLAILIVRVEATHQEAADASSSASSADEKADAIAGIADKLRAD